MPAKLTISASVTVRPCDSHSWPSTRSSKYRWLAVKAIAAISLQKRFRLPFRTGRVDAHVHDFGVGHVNSLGAALNLDGDLHGDRRPPDPHEADQATDDVPDQYGILEFDAVDCDGDEHRHVAAGLNHQVLAAGMGGHIDVAQDDSAEDRALRVQVAGHHHGLQSDVGFGHGHKPRSLRTRAAPAARFVSFAQAIARGVCAKPQSGATWTRSGSMYFNTVRSRSATNSGGSTQLFFTSTNPTATVIGGLISASISTSAISRLANSSASWPTAALPRWGSSGR